MASFCSQCCSDYGMKADIDLFKIAIRLKNGRSVPFICEGCNNRSVYKDEVGLLYLAKENRDTGEITLSQVKLADLMPVVEE